MLSKSSTFILSLSTQTVGATWPDPTGVFFQEKEEPGNDVGGGTWGILYMS